MLSQEAGCFANFFALLTNYLTDLTFGGFSYDIIYSEMK